MLLYNKLFISFNGYLLEGKSDPVRTKKKKKHIYKSDF